MVTRVTRSNKDEKKESFSILLGYTILLRQLFIMPLISAIPLIQRDRFLVISDGVSEIFGIRVFFAGVFIKASQMKVVLCRLSFFIGNRQFFIMRKGAFPFFLAFEDGGHNGVC